MIETFRIWKPSVNVICVVAVGLLMGGEPLFAHHSLSTEFDRDRPVNLEGRIVKVEWQNPHIWIYVEVEDGNGNPTVWGISSGSPYFLQRSGITKETLKIGEVIRFEGYQARDGSNNAAGQTLYADGTELYTDPEEVR